MSTRPAPARPSAAVQCCDIRPLRPGDGLEVRRLFRGSMLGRPLSLEYADLVSYERLCLDWYLTEGRAAARVVDQDGDIVGYLLACLDQSAYEAWMRRRALRWAGRAAYRIATGRLSGHARRFVLLRMREGLTAWRAAQPAPFGAHARFNLSDGVHDGNIDLRLAAAMNEMVEAAGLSGWYGEIDLPGGSSLQTLDRDGAQTTRRAPNETFSWPWDAGPPHGRGPAAPGRP